MSEAVIPGGLFIEVGEIGSAVCKLSHRLIVAQLHYLKQTFFSGFISDSPHCGFYQSIYLFEYTGCGLS